MVLSGLNFYDGTGQAARSLEDVAAEIAQFKELTAPRFDPAYVKIFMDGIPTETASMLEPYVAVGGADELFEPDTAAMVDPIMEGDEGDRGLLFWDVERLANTIVRIEEMGMRGMMFHSVGDRATQVALEHGGEGSDKGSLGVAESSGQLRGGLTQIGPFPGHWSSLGQAWQV